MEIISTDKLKALSGIQNQLLANVTMNLLGLNKVNEIYEKCYHPDPSIFLKRIKESLNLQVDFNEDLLAKIPKKGPFITISNHPFGTIDGIILLDNIRSVRPDFKVMGNYLLSEIKPIADSIIEVDPISKNTSKNQKGIKETLTHLHQGKPLGVFPSGQVSSWAGFGKGVRDKEWEKSVIKLIRKSRVPVIPIYFHGQNSWLFNSLGLIHPQLRTFQIPRESLRKQDSIQVRIGKPIPVKRQDRLKTLNEYRGVFTR